MAKLNGSSVRSARATTRLTQVQLAARAAKNSGKSQTVWASALVLIEDNGLELSQAEYKRLIALAERI